jgi:hypothetical protein
MKGVLFSIRQLMSVWYSALYKGENIAGSHYLERGRLESIIAAIQVLGTRGWASQHIEKLAFDMEAVEEGGGKSIISSEELAKVAAKWETVFREHTEFFKVYTLKNEEKPKVALRWRYATESTYEVATGKDLSLDQAKAMPDRYARLSHKPLDIAQIDSLVKTAIDLHARAIAEKQESHFPLTVLLALTTALVAAAGAFIGSYFHH